MSSQISHQKIRPIVICTIFHENRLFVLEGYDPVKDETFYRPLGGGIEFGERAKEAAVREFQEELNTDITVEEGYQVFENLFTFDGTDSHEIVFVLNATFNDSSFYEKDEFVGIEENGEFKALWVPIQEFLDGDKILYPNGLANILPKP